MRARMAGWMERQVGVAIACVVGWADGLADGRPNGRAKGASGTLMSVIILYDCQCVRVLLKG